MPGGPTQRPSQSGYCAAYLVASGVLFCWSQYLRVRKYRASKRPLPPKLLAKVDADQRAAAVAYANDKCQLAAVGDTVKLVASSAGVALSPWIWRAVRSLVRSSVLLSRVAGPAKGGPRGAAPLRDQIVRGAIVGCAEMVLAALIDLPVDVYSTFVVEARHGFNKHTPATFVQDQAKHLLVNSAISVTMSAVMSAIADVAGANGWLYMWGAVSAMVLGLNMAFPTVIAPLFNKFAPLRDGPVRDRVDQLVAQAGLRCDRVFEVDGSRQSSHSNAYVAGFFNTKRVVIYDTLMKDLDNSPDLVGAVVGHEIGHAVLKHNWAGLGASTAHFFALFGAYGAVASHREALVRSFGFDEVTSGLTLNCFLALYGSFFGPVFGFAMNAFSRRNEFAADRYAVELGLPIDDALVKIAVTNKAELTPDWLDSAFHHSHPPLLERVAAVEAARAQQEGKAKAE